MSNRLSRSKLNPLKFVEVNFEDIPQYVSLHMDDVLHEERLNPYQSLPLGPYYQPWQKNDTISLQFQNNMGQVQIQIVDCHNVAYGTHLMVQKQQNQYDPLYFIYEDITALSLLPEGFYRMTAKVGSSPVLKTLVSEPFEIAERHEGTFLIEYSNPSFKDNFIFATGITPSIRIHGLLLKKETGSKDTMYEDQVLDMVMVKSTNFVLWDFIIGVPHGIPDWMEDKISRIIGCSSLKIDGKYYTKSDGAKLEVDTIIGNGALKTYKIELRETINRDSEISDTDVDTDEELVIVINSTSKGFADADTDTIVTFNDVE